MLQWLRDNLKSLSWTLWLVIIAFILLYIPDFLTSINQANAVATVGEEQVSVEEFRRAYRSLEDNFRQYFGEQFTPEMAEQMQLGLQAIDQLMARKILVTEARRLGLTIDDRELRTAILDAGFVDESGRFMGDELYSRTVRRLGYGSVGEFESGLREDLLVQKLQEVMAANLLILDSEVEAAYREQVERARIRYAVMPVERFAEQAEVGDEELAAYYAARQEEYRQPEKRVVSYLLVDPLRLRQEIEVTDAEVQTFYDEHREEFTVAEQVRARHILLRVDDRRGDEEARSALEAARRRVEAGTDFAVLARELSEDPGSKERGGELGFFGRGQMVPEFEEAAFAAQPGELVGPVRTAHGYHLLEVQERRQGGTRPLAEVSAQIRFRLQNERSAGAAEARARSLAARIRNEGLASDEAWRSLAEADEAVTYDVTPPFARVEPVAGLGRAPAFTEAAFSLDTGGVSEPLQTPRGWAVLRLTSVDEPRVPALSEVLPQVRAALERQKQQELALAALEAARRRVETGEDFAAVASALGLELTESEEFGREDPIPGLSNPAIAAAALDLEAGAVGGPLADRQGVVLFQVAERQSWDPVRFAAERDATREGLERQELNRVLGAFIEERRRSSDVTYNRAMLESLGVNLQTEI